jgi:baculoviral IAP repeat-containing protein 6
MVFSEDPWFNEPGRERNIDKAEANVTANDYNKQIQDATIKYAIINQLKYPEEGFEDVIKAHFELKKDKISAYLLSLDKKVEDVIFNGLLL